MSLLPKVLHIEIYECNDCPYMQYENLQYSYCGMTGNELTKEDIPSDCPLDNLIGGE